jgi:hypothetical protein
LSGATVSNIPFPFIWLGGFSGGVLDTSGAARPEFDDSSLGGPGPTSALTQFARCTAAYLRGFQNTYGVPLHAISIQNELDFDEWYGSCYYPNEAMLPPLRRCGPSWTNTRILRASKSWGPRMC